MWRYAGNYKMLTKRKEMVQKTHVTPQKRPLDRVRLHLWHRASLAVVSLPMEPAAGESRSVPLPGSTPAASRASGEDAGSSFSKKSSKKKRATGGERFKYQKDKRTRRNWYWRQRNRIVKNIKRLKLTTGADAAVVFVPETLNAATYTTAGEEFMDFVERFYLSIEHAKEMKQLAVGVDINEVLSVLHDQVGEYPHALA